MYRIVIIELLLSDICLWNVVTGFNVYISFIIIYLIIISI